VCSTRSSGRGTRTSLPANADDPETIALGKQALDDPESKVRSAALSAFDDARLPDQEKCALFLQAARQSDRDVADSALALLISRGNRSSCPICSRPASASRR